MVAVACDGHDLASGKRLAELLEERARSGQRLAAGAVAQLQQVAEQHQAIDVRQGLQQLCAQLGTPQQIHVRRAAEVEVGDDQRAHSTVGHPSGGRDRERLLR